MQAWNIPETYGEIVLRHHDEECPEHEPLLGVVRLVDTLGNKLGIGLKGKVDVNVAASPEAQWLRASEVALAGLEVHLEDALQLAE